MADAGRILHHLKHNLWREDSSVLFVGFQAEGSMGRRLVEGGKKVRIMGEEISVRARIYNLDGLSAHADRDDMLNWLSRFNPKPATVFLVHGELESAQALANVIGEKMAIPAYIPRYGDVVVFQGKNHQVSPSARLPQMEPALLRLQDSLNELDNVWAEYKQKLEFMVAANSTKVPAILSRLELIRKFVRKTLGDL